MTIQQRIETAEAEVAKIEATPFIKLYFDRSPRGNIRKHKGGFVVHSHRTSFNHPAKTWEQAKGMLFAMNI